MLKQAGIQALEPEHACWAEGEHQLTGPGGRMATLARRNQPSLPWAQASGSLFPISSPFRSPILQ